MGTQKPMQYWTVWFPQAAANGLLLGRGLIDPTDELLLHSAGPVITVEVTDQHGKRVAAGIDLKQTQPSPMCRLQITGDRVEREDIWPTERDYGKLVLMPGGEVGTLKSWWNSEDQKEWRWCVEMYNSLR